MTRVLKSPAKKIQNNEDLSSKLSISKNSKTIKSGDKKFVEIKNEDRKQSDIWNINSILSNIFAYTDRKDLIEFNTVCKKWNNLTNPIIHKTIKLIHNRNIRCRGDIRFENTKNIAISVVECISNNAKHAHLVKEFKYDYSFRPQRAVVVFETFRFICNLTIVHCEMSQGQFLGMISPLTQLKELTISDFAIVRIIEKQYKEPVQLPLTLKKLRLERIKLVYNPELFIQTINSHNNLVEFKSYSCTSNGILEPFYKHYPSLLSFELINREQQIPQSFLKIFEHNPQLINLKLSLKYWSSEIITCINSYLTNLEELKLNEYSDDIDFFAKFSQPTKIKKLSLGWDKLTSCSLSSILINCPHLEELDLNSSTYYKQPNLIKFFDLSNPGKLKKLVINYITLSEGVFESILLKCPNINELSIKLPFEWKEAVKAIYKKCANLERLEISLQLEINDQDRDTFYQEFYKSEFFTINHKCKSTLTHLTLHRSKVHMSKAEYFKTFKSLKSIKILQQTYMYNRTFQETEIDMNLWPGYRLLSVGSYGCDFEFKRNLIY